MGLNIEGSGIMEAACQYLLQWTFMWRGWGLKRWKNKISKNSFINSNSSRANHMGLAFCSIGCWRWGIWIHWRGWQMVLCASKFCVWFKLFSLPWKKLSRNVERERSCERCDPLLQVCSSSQLIARNWVRESNRCSIWHVISLEESHQLRIKKISYPDLLQTSA